MTGTPVLDADEAVAFARFDDKGLLAAVIQEASTGQVPA